MTKNKILTIFRTDTDVSLSLPFAEGGIKAGFPSPAQDYLDLAIDLNKELVRHPASTFYGRVSGESMIDAGLHDGDIVVIDKAITPYDGAMAVCFIDGEFTIKYIELHTDYIMLIPANKAFDPIKVTPGNDFIIWGIVTASVHQYSRKRG